MFLRSSFWVIFLIFSPIVRGVRQEYDYIVVGAGSSGAVVANRLSEDPKNKVLLLEAGDQPELITEIPGLSAHLQLTDYDWKYETVPQKQACLGFDEQRNNWPRGKVLGGSSVLNYMMYVRGNKRDYDKWAEDGAIGWSYKDVLPFFKKSEDNRIPLLDEVYHGSGGNLTIEHPRYKTPLVEAYLKAGEEMGYEVGDYNGASQKAFSFVQGTLRDGKRCSTAKAFLERILGRINLNIITSAFARKINFDKNKRAKEIVFEHRKTIRTVGVRKEIVISAGAINSPQLLMLSGIGPKHHLEHLGISVVSDIPVGENLQDHVMSNAMTFVVDKPFTFLSSRLGTDDVISQLKGEAGLLSTTGGVEVVGFVDTKYNTVDDWPDIELMISSCSPASDGGAVLKKNHRIKNEVFEKYYLPYANNDTISCSPVLQRPKSKGTITLRSSNPYDYPIIDPKYLSHPDDLKIFAEGLKLCLQWASTSAMKNLGAKPLDPKIPGCERHEKFSDDYMECAARSTSQTLQHPLGTCKMGKVTNKDTVVDPALRVKGVRGLRVADASVIPTMISGHPNAACVMIGEKAADLILNDVTKHVEEEL